MHRAPGRAPPALPGVNDCFSDRHFGQSPRVPRGVVRVVEMRETGRGRSFLCFNAEEDVASRMGGFPAFGVNPQEL